MRSLRPDLALFLNDQRLGLPTERSTRLEVTTGPRGLERIGAEVPLSTYQSFEVYRRLGGLVADVTAAGSRVARGRVEDITISDRGASITALGPWRELSDVLYTGLWSASGVSGWAEEGPGISSNLTTWAPQLYDFEFTERIVVRLIKGTTYPAAGARRGGVTFRIPHLSKRDIVGLQFRVRVLVPTGWVWNVERYPNDDYSFGATVTSRTSEGVLIDRAYNLVFTGAKAVGLHVVNDTGMASTPAGETGSWYMLLTDLRVVTSNANRIATKLTANITAGNNVTASVSSTAGMYVGCQLCINNGGAGSEIVTVESITSATQFVADFANNHTSGANVHGAKVRADEVVSSLLSFTKGINSGGVLSSSTALVQICDRDLLNAGWEDTTPADIIGELAERGDGTQRFETGAQGDGALYFRPAGSAAQEWFVDAVDISVQRTLDGLVNSVYARYQDADGRTLRTSASADAVSVRRFGLTRRGVVDADTTVPEIATNVAATALDQTADPVPRASLTVSRIYSPGGNLSPLWLVRSGDTVTIRNLPPAAGAIDRIVTFRVAETTWDATEGTLQLVPESPLPDYEHQAAAIQQAAEVAASASETPAASPITVLPPQQLRRRNPPRIGLPVERS
jgi:hypothetical protein